MFVRQVCVGLRTHPTSYLARMFFGFTPGIQQEPKPEWIKLRPRKGLVHSPLHSGPPLLVCNSWPSIANLPPGTFGREGGQEDRPRRAEGYQACREALKRFLGDPGMGAIGHVIVPFDLDSGSEGPRPNVQRAGPQDLWTASAYQHTGAPGYAETQFLLGL